jgi:hypothetical protein
MKAFIIMGISVYGGIDPDSIKVSLSSKGAKRVESKIKKKYINVMRIERTLKNVK